MMDIQAEIKEIDKQINDEDNAIKYHKVKLAALVRQRNGLNDLLITINEPLNDQNGATDIH